MTIGRNFGILCIRYKKVKNSKKEQALPIHNAAYKSLRSDAKKRGRNEAVIAELKTHAKKLESLISDKKKDEAKKFLKTFESKYMSAASKGVIHKNTASRKISRMFKRVKAIK